MLSVLIEGTLIAAPVRRTSAKGSTFVTAQVRCNAEDGESVLCSVIAFQAATAEALVGLAAGDTVAVAGPAALSQWEKNGEHKVGLKVTATRVLSVYEAGLRRKAASSERESHDSRPTAPPVLPQRSKGREVRRPTRVNDCDACHASCLLLRKKDVCPSAARIPGSASRRFR